VRATVDEKREVAKGTLMVVFDLDGEVVDFRPGQYFFVNLVDPPYEDERGPRRHFSVVTSPNYRGRLGFCTRLRDTGFKRSIQELGVGDEVDVEPPKGNFLLPEDTTQELAFVAGGIGITVFRCMLRYIAEEALPYRITLFFSNRNREVAAFLDELQELERELEGLTLVVTMTDDPEWQGETRKFDADFFREYLGERFDDVTFMVAGPPDMAKGMQQTLLEAGVDEDRVMTDSFSGY
jgi:ferredoxin-NADP reductase